MADKPKLTLTIITQDKQLEPIEVESLTLPTADGEITVLPGHIPLLSRLVTGEMRYRQKHDEHLFVIARGFADVGPDNHITLLVDAAVDAREISVQKAEEAVKAAQHTMTQTVDQRELMLAEASLKRALLEIKVAQKTKRAGI